MKRVIHIVTLLCTLIAFGVVPNVGCVQSITPLVDKNGEPTAIGLKCPSGIVCDRRSEVCGEKGRACDEMSCCFVGDNGRAYGSHKLDAGAGG
jgi:hypothetical protein